MKIFISELPLVSKYVEEIEIIKRLCNYEGVNHYMLYRDNPLWKKYYKGANPVILVYPFAEQTDNFQVLYGFWQLAEFLLKTGKIRC